MCLCVCVSVCLYVYLYVCVCAGMCVCGWLHLWGLRLDYTPNLWGPNSLVRTYTRVLTKIFQNLNQDVTLNILEKSGESPYKYRNDRNMCYTWPPGSSVGTILTKVAHLQPIKLDTETTWLLRSVELATQFEGTDITVYRSYEDLLMDLLKTRQS